MNNHKKDDERISKYESNLRENGTTIDGGFPRHNDWVNPHDVWKVIFLDFIKMIVFCVPLALIFCFILEVGLWESITAIITGKEALNGSGIKNFVIFFLFAIVLVVYPLVVIIEAIVYAIMGEKSFKLSKPIKKMWDKHLGKYVYKQ